MVLNYQIQQGKVKCQSSVKYILMDGTLKVALPRIMQVYTIHCGYCEMIHFKVLYVLMKERMGVDYEK